MSKEQLVILLVLVSAKVALATEGGLSSEKVKEPGFIERLLGVGKARPEPVKVVEQPKVKFRYPVNFAPAGEEALRIDSAPTKEGDDVATIMQRFYVWQQQDEDGRLLELQADGAVVFYSREELSSDKDSKRSGGILAERVVKAIYLRGDVVMTEGQRTIRADEVYYDFEAKKALVINAVMRNFDESRGIPIYVRAAKLRQLAENKFSADDITLTSSEFYLPQFSLTASSVVITDTTTIDAQLEQLSDSSYDIQMRDVRFNVGERTIFHWPFMRSNLQRPDVPLKNVRVGNDSIWGTSVESRWYLARLLGLKEPKGTDSTFMVDYYSDRGIGSGMEIDYKRDNYFGTTTGYLIHDRGEDKLGRHSSRKDVKPERRVRGRFSWLHRHFLPYDWQVTTGVSYVSDENFTEAYYRNEFSAVRQETYIHVKRSEDNWAVSLLGKGRMNDFSDELEESPSAGFYVKGQSLFRDLFTLYSDTEVGRLRQRIGDNHSTVIDKERFSFVSHRTELDIPIQADAFKVVPFVAGTFGYDDRSGFTRTLVDGSNKGKFGEDKIWIGEAGVRVGTQYWKVYPDVKSRLWDLNGLRHVIRPRLTAVAYKENDSAVKQRDTLSAGISQRLQTKRGTADKRETIDWIRLDTDFTWVRDSGDSSSGPDELIWYKPITPLRILSAPEIFNGDLVDELKRFEDFGPRRNYFSTDFLWRMSDTGAILSDMNFDMQSGVVQQFNVGFSRLCWPNLSYYIGSRYLRRAEVLNEKGSNALTFAATYIVDPRYTVVFAQQFDFDYGANMRSDITLIRRYHRVYWALTYSADGSLDRQAIMFSIWPQGVPELAIGKRSYMSITE